MEKIIINIYDEYKSTKGRRVFSPFFRNNFVASWNHSAYRIILLATENQCLTLDAFMSIVYFYSG